MNTNWTPRILIVDDDVDMIAVLKSCLEDRGFRVDFSINLDDMKSRIRQFSYDGILLDLFLGDENGVEAIPFIVRERPFAVVVVMTAFGTVELAVEALEKGAVTVIGKSDNPEKIVTALVDRLKFRNSHYSAATSISDACHSLGLLGESPAMVELFDVIQKVAEVDATVLINGESGSGKELVARALHRLSQRRNGIFEALNCAAIPAALLESELFGHKKGAFTDAKEDRKGMFEICTDGTLLLDEIGEMPMAMQAKLLRVVQEKEVTPLGQSKTIKVNTRIIAATHRDLGDEVGRGMFREDLYYRLNVINIYLPPLRERKADIGMLVNAFIDKFNARYQKDILPISREVLLRLESYTWPGNIRELQNSIERAVVLSKGRHLQIEDVLQRELKQAKQPPAALGDFSTLTYAEAKEAFEKSFLSQILSAAKGSIAEAARLSGRYRSDIYRLMERYGFDIEEFK